MNEQDGYQVPPPLDFSLAFDSFKKLHLSSNGSNGSHDFALSSWPLVTSQQITHYDETSQYFADSGGGPVAGMQDVTVVSDFQESFHVDPGSACMDNFMGSSYQTEFLDVNMLDDCKYQDLARIAGLSCFGQFENTNNESLTTRSVRDIGLTTDVPLLENYVLAQNHTSRTQEVNGNDLHVCQSHLEPNKPASSFDSKRCRKLSREKLHARDYHMRCRISKGIQDLEKLLPHPAKNQGEVVTKSIEYMKHLQLQLKELSQNRLGSETDTDLFLSLKRSGFHLPPHMFQEQLKDIFAQLLQENPAAAMELLESRGLHKVPMAFVKAVPQIE